MKKILSVLLLGALIFGLLTGCQSANFPEGFSKAKAEEITRHWLEENPYDAIPWYHIDGFGSYYLGHDNGYDIFFYDGKRAMLIIFEDPPTEEQIRDFYTLRIGDSVFYPCAYEQLNVYKDGEILLLTEAYEQGLVSSEAVAAAATTFDAYIKTILSSDTMEVAEARWKYYSKYYSEDEIILKWYQEEYEKRMDLDYPYLDWYKKRFLD